ncbi:MAG: polyprenol monophosphomannose synthase [Solirubrobacteraceae bacterium]
MANGASTLSAGPLRADSLDPNMVPDLTVVVPTRNERDNIAPLLRRLERVRPELDVEVLFVDDSTDETPEVIEIEARRSSRRVAVIHRSGGERAGGLGGAVQAGMVAARGRLVCVMDADLQHPPELLGALLDAGQGPDVDVVVASRYCERGEVGEFSTLRTLLSRASARAAKLLFPRRLRAVSDPMSGYFLIRRSSLDVVALRPRGFKILLEILVSGHTFTVAEVPFRFGERRAGDSKASVREGLRYLRRLIELRTLGQPRRFAGVAGVGALGVA